MLHALNPPHSAFLYLQFGMVSSLHPTSFFILIKLHAIQEVGAGYVQFWYSYSVQGISQFFFHTLQSKAMLVIQLCFQSVL